MIKRRTEKLFTGMLCKNETKQNFCSSSHCCLLLASISVLFHALCMQIILSFVQVAG